MILHISVICKDSQVLKVVLFPAMDTYQDLEGGRSPAESRGVQAQSSTGLFTGGCLAWREGQWEVKSIMQNLLFPVVMESIHVCSLTSRLPSKSHWDFESCTFTAAGHALGLWNQSQLPRFRTLQSKAGVHHKSCRPCKQHRQAELRALHTK